MILTNIKKCNLQFNLISTPPAKKIYNVQFLSSKVKSKSFERLMLNYFCELSTIQIPYSLVFLQPEAI